MKYEYSQSYALVIGINAYQNCNPLRYATNDAAAIHKKLIEDFDFPPENTRLLLDEEATATEIRKAYLRFTEQDIQLDDRIFVFFAGHGTTRRGMRGEVGYLTPVDADIDQISTLIRWDDLTRNIELIPAKHILFVMDACYGGLAITRSTHSGSARFLKDMLKRVSRQVLTAGKADEEVADAGGPIPGHSVFTGHLLQGLDGAAATKEGVLTANNVMSYVYSKVNSDAGSFQTPHFGHIDGDGDFIFKADILNARSDDDKFDFDSFVIVPYPEETVSRTDLKSKVIRTKILLGDPEKSIELHDFVVDEVKKFLSATNEESFDTQTEFSLDKMLDRLSRYESLTKDLAVIEACIAYWATPAHRQILKKAISRSTDHFKTQGGLNVWLSLRWYPLVLQTYCTGIAAIEGGRYDALSDLFFTEIQDGEKSQSLLRKVSSAISEFSRSDIFKDIPGYEQKYTPMSEYLFKLLQPQLDDALFIGRNYEQIFDEFEIILALSSVDDQKQSKRNAWGPVGRFGWKHMNEDHSPFNKLIERAKLEGEKWPPIKGGLFGGDTERFDEASSYFLDGVLKRLGWY